MLLPMGGITSRTACGITTLRSAWPRLQAERARGLHLALVDGEDRGLDQFGIVDREMQAEPDDARDEGRQVDADLDQAEIDQEELQQQRRAHEQPLEQRGTADGRSRARRAR